MPWGPPSPVTLNWDHLHTWRAAYRASPEAQWWQIWGTGWALFPLLAFRASMQSKHLQSSSMVQAGLPASLSESGLEDLVLNLTQVAACCLTNSSSARFMF